MPQIDISLYTIKLSQALLKLIIEDFCQRFSANSDFQAFCSMIKPSFPKMEHSMYCMNTLTNLTEIQ
jgi:hypothetical protein